MLESIVAAARNRLYHGGQWLLPKRDEPMEGRPEAATPPESALPPFGSYGSGGMPGMGGVQRGEGTAGGVGISCAVLPTDRPSVFLTH